MEGFNPKKNKRSALGKFAEGFRKTANAATVAVGILGAASYVGDKLEKTPVEKKIERVLPKITPEKVVVNNDVEITGSVSGRDLIVKTKTHTLNVLGIARTEAEKDFLKFIFTVPKKEELDKILLGSKRNSPAKDAALSSEIDQFYMVWNVYREAGLRVHYTRGLLNERNKLRKVVEDLDKRMQILKSRNQGSLELEIKYINQKKELDEIQSIVDVETTEGKIELYAEKLAIMLNVLERALDKRYPEGLAENILKTDQYSWTRQKEGKFPSLQPQKNTEPIDLAILAEINSLYLEFVKGKSPAQAKSFLRKEIAKTYGILESEIPDRLTVYNTEDSMPKEDGKFSDYTRKNSGSRTKERLKKAKDMLKKGEIQGIIINRHLFSQEKR